MCRIITSQKRQNAGARERRQPVVHTADTSSSTPAPASSSQQLFIWGRSTGKHLWHYYAGQQCLCRKQGQRAIDLLAATMPLMHICKACKRIYNEQQRYTTITQSYQQREYWELHQ